MQRVQGGVSPQGGRGWAPAQGGGTPQGRRGWAPYEGTTWGNSSSGGGSWSHKASDTGRRWSGCSLDDTNCLTLQQILHSFTAPISEEHAWAVIYESLQCLDRLLDDLVTCDTVAHIVSSTEHILIHNDGHIHTGTFNTKKNPGASRPRLRSENKAVAELGVVIFNALDYGLKEDEERQLSPALENILDLMTSADEGETIEDDDRPETDDEGIERDHDEQDEGRKVESGTDGCHISRSGVSARLSHLARNHLALPSEADSHFRAVCRALVSEALELSSFMEKVSSRKRDKGNDDMLQELGLNDWARLWVQVIHELRNGIKLKKTDFSKTPIEYELTPYEILMDDIRSRRYKLNKVMVEGDLAPRMKRDAHDIILDFIRSRPPLKPVSDRKLPDARKTSTPLELLMESIRNTDSRASLRKTTGPPMRPLLISAVESSRTKLLDQEPSPIPSRKKMIRPDPNLMSELLNFSDDASDDDDSNTSEDNEEEDGIYGKEPPPKRDWHKQLTRDLALHGPSLGHRRRHSVTVCETPSKPHKVISVDLSDEMDSPVSTCSSQSSCSVSVDLWNDKEDSNVGDSRDSVLPQYSLNTPQMHANLHSEFLNSVSFLLAEPLNGYFLGSHWRTMAWSSSCRLGLLGSLDCSFPTWLDMRLQVQYKGWMCATSPGDKLRVFEQWVAALQTLDLTLEEVVHIRSVLTRAELEALPLDGTLKEDVEKGKICFLCMRTKFGLFTWGQRCQMCSQQVCKRCCTTLRIPLEHFAAIPVFALSPNSISPEPLEEPGLLSRLSSPSTTSMLSRVSSLAVPDLGLFSSSTSAGSTPTSPSLARKRPSSTGPTSLPVYTSAGPSTMSGRLFVGQRSMSREEKKASLQGSLMSVCLDCKEMVLQVIRAQKTAKRLQMTKSLFLNLTPVYPKEEVF